MARAPNYDFERKERERHKKLKNAERADARIKKPSGEVENSLPDQGPTER